MFAIPLNISSGAQASADAWGNAFGAGDWTVNVAGSGKSAQSASGGGAPSLLVIALIAGAAWFLLKR